MMDINAPPKRRGTPCKVCLFESGNPEEKSVSAIYVCNRFPVLPNNYWDSSDWLYAIGMTIQRMNHFARGKPDIFRWKKEVRKIRLGKFLVGLFPINRGTHQWYTSDMPTARSETEIKNAGIPDNRGILVAITKIVNGLYTVFRRNVMTEYLGFYRDRNARMEELYPVRCGKQLMIEIEIK